MIKKNEIVELNIEKLAYGGEGIGRIEGMTVFVPDTVAGDHIKAKIVSIKKNFTKALVTEIITPSEYRIKPFCPLAKVCGGCQWQHIDYEEQLRAKKKIVEECMQKIAGIDIPVKDVLRSDEITEYRCKVQYPVQQTKISKRFLVGYYRKHTHEIVNIKYCPIQPRIIDEITEFLREKAQELNLTAYDEENKKGLIRHFVFRYSQTNKDLLLTVVINEKNTHAGINELCISAKNKFPVISGVSVNFNTSRSNLIMGNKTELIEGKNDIEEILEEKIFRISAESFFQVNPLMAQKMFSEVKRIVQDKLLTDAKKQSIPSRHCEKAQSADEAIHQNKWIASSQAPRNDISILDVYAGSGSFSIFLSNLASNITAVEESESSINDGLENLKLNKIENISFIKGNADDVLADLDGKYDLVVLDPPRKGCSESVIEAVKKLAEKYVIYISCNPSTLARDIKLLSDNFIPEFIQPVDMFCHTYHVESIAVLSRI